jgi:hypothetical protein
MKEGWKDNWDAKWLKLVEFIESKSMSITIATLKYKCPQFSFKYWYLSILYKIIVASIKDDHIWDYIPNECDD